MKLFISGSSLEVRSHDSETPMVETVLSEEGHQVSASPPVCKAHDVQLSFYSTVFVLYTLFILCTSMTWSLNSIFFAILSKDQYK